MTATRREVRENLTAPTAGEYDAAYLRYLTRPRSRVREAVRRAYLRSLRSLTRGITLDYGCGAGELLGMLPPGSEGAEVNDDAVEHCRARGYTVTAVKPNDHEVDIAWVPPGRFETIVLSHVLEHLSDPAATLRELLLACARSGISRIVIVVPGAAGYKTDSTHRTFVDEAYLASHGLLHPTAIGWNVTYFRHFPANSPLLARLIPWQELQLIYERSA